MVVRSGEDDDGLRGQAGEDFEAVEARHLDVEEADVGRMCGEGRDGVFGRGGSAGDFDAAGAVEETAETLEGEGFVVDQIGTQLHTRGTIISTTE